MKKILSIILAIATVACAGSITADAGTNRILKKALKKEYKAKMKEYKKGGWELYGSSRSLDVQLLTHYEKLNQENVSEIVGVASKVANKAVGHQVAINDACRTYAQTSGSYVKGRITSDLAADGEDVAAEFDHFYAAYERLVESEIKGELIESYTIVRQTGKDKQTKKDDKKKVTTPVYEMQTYFIVDVTGATAARIRAYEAAAKESEAAQRYAEKVSDYVKEGFAK
ncbi:MAG: hypothetical protein MJY62_04905 [Bacteroidales bacterium]|nr:hypothetical protein [Bacteroidales bacterium]